MDLSRQTRTHKSARPLSLPSWHSLFRAAGPRNSCESLRLHRGRSTKVTLRCRQVPSIKRGLSFYVELTSKSRRDSIVPRCALLASFGLEPEARLLIRALAEGSKVDAVYSLSRHITRQEDATTTDYHLGSSGVVLFSCLHGSPYRRPPTSRLHP